MMESFIGFAPLIPWPVIAVLAGVCAFGLLIAVLRGLGGWLLRGAAMMCVLAGLAQPQLRQEERETLTNIVFLVADSTESQSVSDRSAQMSQALDGLTRRISGLEDYELVPVRIENDSEDRDSGSMVLSALAKAASEVSETRIAGAVILTDGQIHDADVLSQFPAPVHILTTGRSTDWDRRLVIRNAPSFGIVGEPVSMFLSIEDLGAVPANIAGTARLEVSIDGAPPQQFRVETGREFDVPITLSHGGLNVLQFRVLPEDGELTDRNNAAVLSVNGVRDRLRVLLVSGAPHAGERTWRNLLKSDAAVDLVHFTILRSPDKLDGVPVRELSLIAFPTRELFLEKIDEFDLIIFDRYRRRGILPNRYLSNVADYVRAGGAVLVASGPAFGGVDSLWRTPLADILPATPTTQIIEEGFTPRISRIGARHPVTEALENHAPRAATDDGTPGWGRWMRLIEAEARSGHTVMSGVEGKPLLVLDRVGEGRIAMMLSDHAWLWSRGFEGGGPQLELLRRLAHWMMKEPDLEEERILAEVQGNSVLVTRRTLDEAIAPVTVTGPEGAKIDLDLTQQSPGKWTGRFDGAENGLYTLTDGTQTAVVAVGPTAPREFERTIADPIALEPLASATRGGILALEDQPDPKLREVRAGRVAAGRTWIGLTPRNAYLTTSVSQTPLPPGWVLLVLAAALMIAAWRFEGR